MMVCQEPTLATRLDDTIGYTLSGQARLLFQVEDKGSGADGDMDKEPAMENDDKAHGTLP
jgi:hypothetical protein